MSVVIQTWRMITYLIVKNKSDSTSNNWSIQKWNKLFIGLTIVRVIMRPTDVKRKLLKENRLGSKGKGESSARSLSQTTCMKKTTYTPTQVSYKTTIYQSERKKRTVVYCFVNGVFTPMRNVKNMIIKRGNIVYLTSKPASLTAWRHCLVLLISGRPLPSSISSLILLWVALFGS